MRCYCCNELPTRLYKGEYLCAECTSVIRQTKKEDYDTHSNRIGTGYGWSDDTSLIHCAWDDDSRERPPVTLPKMKEKEDD